MPVKSSRTLTAAIGVAAATATSVAIPPHDARLASWYRCDISMYGRTCFTYPVRSAPGTPVGWWIACSPNDEAIPRRCARIPKFRLPPAPPPVIDMAAAARPFAWQWRNTIADASRQTGVPTRVLAAIVSVESRGVFPSCDGPAYGLTQVLPATGASVWGMAGVSIDEGTMVTKLCADPSFDVLTGAMYIQYQHQHYGVDWALAAGYYNGGSWAPPAYVRSFLAFYQ